MTNDLSAPSDPASYATRLHALEELAQRIVDAARMEASDGTPFICPDGNIYYKGLWARDFCYAAEGLPDIVSDREVEVCFERLIAKQRPDGAMPANVNPDGSVAYVCCGDNATQACGDTGPFMVKLADVPVRRGSDYSLYERHLDALARGLDNVPRNREGLVWIDSAHPHSGYGFRELVAVTGADCYCTLLFWESAVKLSRAARELGRADLADRFAREAALIEENLHLLLDPEAGVFLAGTEGERHIDIWANAYFIHLDLPRPDLRDPVLSFLRERHEDYLQDGQVRHLLKGESWDRIFHYDMPEGTYMNGAYWGTASGWVIDALSRVNTDLARRIGEALMDDFLEHGAYECVNRGFLWGGHGVELTKIPDYVATIANPLPVLRGLVKN